MDDTRSRRRPTEQCSGKASVCTAQEVALRIAALAHLQKKAPRGATYPGRRGKVFFVSSLYVRVLQSARFGYRGANGNEAHYIQNEQNKQVDNSSLYQTKPKTTRLQKRVSWGVVLMGSAMLHEKCCNTVLQIGAPVILVSRVSIPQCKYGNPS